MTTDAEIKMLKKELKDLEKQYEEAQDLEPFVERAAEILDKMQSDMPEGMGWLERMKDEANTRHLVMSPIGRIRHLFRTFLGTRRIEGDAGRKAKNSPIQGMSSEVGVVAGYLAYEACENYRRERTEVTLISKLCRLVHDATYMCTPYRLVLPQIQIGQYMATAGVANYYQKHFNFKMLSPPEIEVELCAREDQAYKWDWTIDNLFEIVHKSLVDHKDLGMLKDVDKAMKAIFQPWIDLEERNWLFDNYPLFGHNAKALGKQIDDALKKYNLI